MKVFSTFSKLLVTASFPAVVSATTDRACRSDHPKADGVIFGTPEDAAVEYFQGFKCPHPKPGDKDYYCRTRTSDNAISFDMNNGVMKVDTNPWVSGGFRMGCMKKDFTTGWQCAAACGMGPKLPTLSDWAFLTFDVKLDRTNQCNGRVKFSKNSWPVLESKSIELSGNYIEGNADADGWRRVIIPTHDFKTCEWPNLENARDLLFQNCDGKKGPHPKYEVRHIKLTNLLDIQDEFEGCACSCQEGSHDIFVDECTTPPTTTTESTTSATTTVPTKTVFKDLGNLCGEVDDLLQWKLDVPIGAEKLYCKSWGGSGNVALYINWDSPIGATNTCVANKDGCNNQEECSGDKLKPYGSTLYLGVKGVEAFCDVSVTCSYEMIDEGNTDTPNYLAITPPSTTTSTTLPTDVLPTTTSIPVTTATTTTTTTPIPSTTTTTTATTTTTTPATTTPATTTAVATTTTVATAPAVAEANTSAAETCACASGGSPQESYYIKANTYNSDVLPYTLQSPDFALPKGKANCFPDKTVTDASSFGPGGKFDGDFIIEGASPDNTLEDDQIRVTLTGLAAQECFIQDDGHFHKAATSCIPGMLTHSQSCSKSVTFDQALDMDGKQNQGISNIQVFISCCSK